MIPRFPFYRQFDAMDCGPACLRLITRYHGKTIPLRQRMSGIATLITEDKSILERIFEKFLNIVKNR
jgi:ATP-binding cassette subfamily B protein